MDKLKLSGKTLDKFKYPALILLIGVLLMALPTGSSSTAEGADDESARAAEILSRTEGVGEAIVLISENGAVVVCEGADSAAVKLSIVKAISSYTGFGSDRITILKMTDHSN